MNLLTPTEIARLSDEYLKGTISDQDRAVFEAWLFTQPENPLTWTLHHSAAEVEKEMQDNIFSKINRRPINLPGIIKYAAAAVVIVASLTILYLSLIPKKNLPHPQTIAHANDFLPGTKKASLTLADGTIINLDSAAIGAVANQGNVSITKTADGLINYTPAGRSGTSGAYNTMTTPKGGKYQLRLPDGTRVWLNAASSITYPVTFNGNQRSVRITGEVYFEVASNPSKPFHVSAGDQQLTVLGTHFNIKAYADEALLTTTLLEGKVSVKKQQVNHR